jgi:photosystem II stability/assembly factor-like uncharacterized protein
MHMAFRFISFTNFRYFLEILFLILTGLFCFNTYLAYAHSPHDVIDALEISPAYDRDKTIFITTSDELIKSNDGGFSWKRLSNGLDHKGIILDVKISESYHFDKTIYISSDGDGVYKSDDGGKSWRIINSGLKNLHIRLLSIVEVSSAQIVLAAGKEGGLYKTQNGGNYWYEVIKDLKITALASFRGEKSGHIIAGDSLGSLYLSADNGESWSLIQKVSDWGEINSIAIPPTNDRQERFFVGTEKNGVYKTIDNGMTFRTVNSGLPDQANVRSIVISRDYEKDKTIFVSTWYEAIFRSTDAGETWEKFKQGLSLDKQANSTMYKSPHFRDLQLSNTFAIDKTIYLAGFDGLFKSTDGGRKWHQLETLPVKLIKGLAVSSNEDESSTIAITTYGAGAYLTHDEGFTWVIKNQGLTRTRLSDIVFSTNFNSNSDADPVLFSAQKNYLLKSSTDGSRWIPVSLASKSWRMKLYNGLAKFGIKSSIRKKILKKSERKIPYPTIISVSPDYFSDHTIYFGTRSHGIFKSIDGAEINSAVWNGADGRTITSVAISPDFSSDNTLFAGVRELGVFKTTDGGNSWYPVNKGISIINNWQQLETLHSIKRKDVKLAISPNYKYDKIVFAAFSEGLFRSSNGGNSWTKLKGSAYGGNGYILCVAVSPNYEKDHTLIASLKGKGLFQSTDGGDHFYSIASISNR